MNLLDPSIADVSNLQSGDKGYLVRDSSDRRVDLYAAIYQMVTGTAALLTNYNISATVGGTPATGTIRYNNATQTSATQLLMSCTASDGLDLTNFIAQTGINDTIYLQEETNSANYQKWKFTTTPTFGSGYATFGIELVSSSGTGTTNFADALPVITYGKAAAAPLTTDALPEGSTNLYFTTARVLETALSGLSLVSGTAITAADTVLSALGKLQKQVTDLVASVAAVQNYTSLVSAATMVSGTKYRANVSGGVFATAPKFPASPTAGDSIFVLDSHGLAATNNLTLDGNGKNIIGVLADGTTTFSASTFVIDKAYARIEFVYNGTAWVVCAVVASN